VFEARYCPPAEFVEDDGEGEGGELGGGEPACDEADFARGDDLACGDEDKAGREHDRHVSKAKVTRRLEQRQHRSEQHFSAVLAREEADGEVVGEEQQRKEQKHGDDGAGETEGSSVHAELDRPYQHEQRSDTDGDMEPVGEQIALALWVGEEETDGQQDVRGRSDALDVWSRCA
jgi:hypothetical protein